MNPYHLTIARSVVVIITTSVLLAPAITQAQNYNLGGRIPLLIRRPVTELQILHSVQRGELETELRSNSTQSEATQLTLSTATSGFVYHPALVKFDARVNQTFHGSAYENQRFLVNDKASGKFFGYNINTKWLERKNYNLDWSTSRTRRTNAYSAMRPESTTISEDSALAVHLKTRSWPTTFSSSESKYEVESWYPERRRDQVRKLAGQHRSQTGESQYFLIQRDTTRTIRDRSVSVETENLGFVHSRDIGEKNRFNFAVDSISQLVSGVERTASMAISGLTLVHPGNLDTNWSVSLNKSAYGDVENSTRSLSGRARHQLYENLATTLGISETQNRSEVGNRDQQSMSLNMSYARNTPWGNVRLGRSKAITGLDDRRTSRYSDIVDEAYTFEGISTSIVLLNGNIDIESVSVISADRQTAFERGVDYLIEEIGGAVIINRNNLAGIGDNDSVLISYRFLTDPPSNRRSHSDQLSGGLRIGNVNVTFSTRRQQSKILEGEIPDRLPWLDSSTFTASYDANRSNTSLRIHRVRNELSRYESRSLVHQVRFRPTERSTLNINLQANQLDFLDAGESKQEVGLNASFSTPLGLSGRFGSNAFISRSSGDFEDRTNWGLNARYSWRYGSWKPTIQTAYSDINDSYSEFRSSGFTLSFMATRTFR